MRLPAFFLCLIFLQTPILAIFFQKFRNSELSIEIQEIVELFSDSLENLREISNYAKDEMEQMIDQFQEDPEILLAKIQNKVEKMTRKMSKFSNRFESEIVPIFYDKNSPRQARRAEKLRKLNDIVKKSFSIIECVYNELTPVQKKLLKKLLIKLSLGGISYVLVPVEESEDFRYGVEIVMEGMEILDVPMVWDLFDRVDNRVDVDDENDEDDYVVNERASRFRKRQFGHQKRKFPKIQNFIDGLYDENQDFSKCFSMRFLP